MQLTGVGQHFLIIFDAVVAGSRMYSRERKEPFLLFASQAPPALSPPPPPPVYVEHIFIMACCSPGEPETAVM